MSNIQDVNLSQDLKQTDVSIKLDTRVDRFGTFKRRKTINIDRVRLDCTPRRFSRNR